MSEYWVSRKKYFCKYCDIYIADDAPSRSHHENGMRHKGNKERFVRGLYKSGEKRKKDLEEEKRDIARIEQAAQAAFAQDVGAGHARASTSSAPVASTSTADRKPPPKPSNPYANYSTAESLGYVDPDLERLKAEAERRRTMGVAGDWEVIPDSKPAESISDLPSSGAPVSSDSGLKREADAPADEEDGRQFKLRKKTWGAGLGEIYDPGNIPIKLKAKKEEAPEGGTDVSAIVASPSDGPKATVVPKWTKIEWKRADKVASGEVPKQEHEDGSTSVLAEDRRSGGMQHKGEEETHVDRVLQPRPEPVEKEDTVKVEDLPSEPLAVDAGGGLFRKRKTPGGVGSRGRRRF